jgi:hypothetical protein
MAEVVRDVGVKATMLVRWFRVAVSKPARQRVWKAAARLAAVIATAALNDTRLYILSTNEQQRESDESQAQIEAWTEKLLCSFYPFGDDDDFKEDSVEIYRAVSYRRVAAIFRANCGAGPIPTGSRGISFVIGRSRLCAVDYGGFSTCDEL